ncbi:MAG: response regulator [Clostridia bacterium]|nr:response regulator [Clostridia bacterium]
MYKVLIADDERIIRERLSSFISRNVDYLEVVETFKDGKYVIDYLKENEADIIIADIIMLNVSGIDVAKYIYENKINTKVIILSSYKEFEYAKKAIEYNVSEYLVKPTDFDKLLESLSKIKKELDNERLEKKEKNHYFEIIPVLREQFFVDLVMGAIKSKDEIDKQLKFLGFDFLPEKTKCIFLEINIINYNDFSNQSWKHGKDRINTMILNIINDGDNMGEFYETYCRDGRIRVIYVSENFSEIYEIEEYLNNKIEKAGGYLSDNFGLSIDADILCRFESIYDFATGQNIIQSDKNSHDNEETLLVERIRLLATYIRSDSCEEAINIFESIIDSSKSLSEEKICEKACKLFEMVYSIFSEIGVSIQYVKKSKLDYKMILFCRNYDEIMEFGKRLIFDITKYIEQFDVDSSEIIIRNAKQFINDNYHLDISLQDVADSVFLSQKYFSKFFKDKTGENYLDYLRKIRMEHAIEMLAEGCKIEKISKAIGYGSSRYFTRRFKQYTGFTPKEYYRRILNGDKIE